MGSGKIARLYSTDELIQEKKSGRLSPSVGYNTFDQINGSHPLRQAVEDICIEYQARKRKGGKVSFFNFNLAREMGLIGENHPDIMNEELNRKILDTFSIIIINEYDIQHNKKFPSKDIKENSYMATRYLQLQHPNKKGATSGDGRSIWNGCFKSDKGIWDISSCGTGATKLSPATNIQGKFFESGDPSISYGCGYSEVDEGLGTLFFSEIFSKNKISTERVLAIIEFPDNIAINVRAHPNLIRPSHLFRFLKQNNLSSLRQIVDYYIDRQIQNKIWSDVPKDSKGRYQYFLHKVTEAFAKVAARFEDDYIFCWIDWDGDNILMDAGIIDYGSIRQFGLFHHEYRYDDDDRYSTSIVEQKLKARYSVQVFNQIYDYLIHGKKRKIKYFYKAQFPKLFDRLFQDEKRKNILYKIGFEEKQAEVLLGKDQVLVDRFIKTFAFFERAKSSEGMKNVADGINWNAIYCMRDILRENPQMLLARDMKILNYEEFIAILRSNYAKDKDVRKTPYRWLMARQFQKFYIQLVKRMAELTHTPVEKVLLKLTMRSSVINKYDRVTGDSITNVVDLLMNSKRRSNPEELFRILQDFVNFQITNPDVKEQVNTLQLKDPLIRDLLQIVRDCREGL